MGKPSFCHPTIGGIFLYDPVTYLLTNENCRLCDIFLRLYYYNKPLQSQVKKQLSVNFGAAITYKSDPMSSDALHDKVWEHLVTLVNAIRHNTCTTVYLGQK